MEKVTLITGASSGIGQAIYKKLKENNFSLVLNGRSLSDRVQDTNVVISRLDLIDNEAPKELLKTAINAFGRLDYVFINAGTIESASIENIDREDVLYDETKSRVIIQAYIHSVEIYERTRYRAYIHYIQCSWDND